MAATFTGLGWWVILAESFESLLLNPAPPSPEAPVAVPARVEQVELSKE